MYGLSLEQGSTRGQHSKFCFNLFNILILSKNENKNLLPNFFLSKKLILKNVFLSTYKTFLFDLPTPGLEKLEIKITTKNNEF